MKKELKEILKRMNKEQLEKMCKTSGICISFNIEKEKMISIITNYLDQYDEFQYSELCNKKKEDIEKTIESYKRLAMLNYNANEIKLIQRSKLPFKEWIDKYGEKYSKVFPKAENFEQLEELLYKN